MSQIITPAAARTAPAASGYRVDPFRSERVGRVSSEWFSRPADQRFLSLSDLHLSMKARAERSRARTVKSRDVRVGVRPVLDEAGAETGRYAVVAGGRRLAALQLLVRAKRLNKTVPVPCTVGRAAVVAEEDSLTKARILAAVRGARGEAAAGLRQPLPRGGRATIDGIRR